MPPIKKHLDLSFKRTGKDYREIHEWMDSKDISKKERTERHNIINIQKFLPLIEKQFGKDAAEEYLYHIKEDYENNKLFKLYRKIKNFCKSKS